MISRALAFLLTVSAVALMLFDSPKPQTRFEPVFSNHFLQAGSFARDRVIELPEDGKTWHTVTLYDSDPPTSNASRRLKQNMLETPRLQSLVKQTKHHVYTPRSSWARRYDQRTQAPAVWVMTDDGKVVYKATAENLPHDGETLADEIQTQIDRHYPRDCGPDGCRPDSLFDRRPNSHQGIPDIRPTHVTQGSGNNLLVVVAIVVALLFALIARR